jgi:hypothetical protein
MAINARTSGALTRFGDSPTSPEPSPGSGTHRPLPRGEEKGRGEGEKRPRKPGGLRYRLSALFKKRTPEEERAIRRELIALYAAVRAQLLASVRHIEGELDGGGSDEARKARAVTRLVQIEALIEQFSKSAESRVLTGVRLSLDAGVERGVSNVLKLGIAYNRPAQTVLEELAAQMTPRGAISKLFSEFGPQAAAKAKNTIFTGVALGTPTKTIGRQLAKDLEIPLNRGLLIATDRINSAQRAGTLALYRASTAVKAWRWSASLSSRTCPVCLAMDGTVHPLTEDMASHPSCRCTMTPVLDPSKPITRQTGEQWFARQSVKVQRQILGATKYELYRDGKLKLADLVVKTSHPLWGPGRTTASLGRLMSSKKVSAKDILAATKAGIERRRFADKLPVSTAILLPKSGKTLPALKTAMDAIDKVHVDGELPQIVTQVLSRYPSEGELIPTARGGPNIIIKGSTPYPAFTMVHEVGHGLDVEAWGLGGGTVTHLDPALAEWRTAIGDSEAIQELLNYRFGLKMKAEREGLTADELDFAKYVGYLLRPHEAWARSYAQYIAVQSGDNELMAGLNDSRKPDNLPAQWTDEDFAPIRSAIDALFRKKGWK